MEKLLAGARKLGLELSQEQVEQFSIYYQELVDWNQRMNLTAITDYEEVQIKHFLDSLTIALVWQPEKGARVIDVGTGAGFPGLPLKITFPGINLLLLEATRKKTTFLSHIMQKLGLMDVEVVAGRAEEVAHQSQYREKFDVVLSRAVATLSTLVELTLPFCTVGGRVIEMKKGDIDQEVNSSVKAIKLLGGRLAELKKVTIEELSDERWLVVIEKISPTPDLYPRRSGIPAKRPIV